jgi:type IV secretion system protein TrbG
MTRFAFQIIALAGLLLFDPIQGAKAGPKRQVYPHSTTAASPTAIVGRANDASRIKPSADSANLAGQIYTYANGALFEIYTAVGKVTDIVLEPGERLVGNGPVAAGDTVRWVIGDTESGQGETRQVHILVKPTQARLSTNLVINTDRRTYHIELQSHDKVYMAVVSWRYSHDDLMAIQQKSEAERRLHPVAAGIDPLRLNFAYRVEGDSVDWKPVRAFDDGVHVYIELPPSITTAELPPLFIKGRSGTVELVNYRLKARYLIVDRLFKTAELRLGDKYSQKSVRIRRTDGAKL